MGQSPGGNGKQHQRSNSQQRLKPNVLNVHREKAFSDIFCASFSGPVCKIYHYITAETEYEYLCLSQCFITFTQSLPHFCLLKISPLYGLDSWSPFMGAANSDVPDSHIDLNKIPHSSSSSFYAFWNISIIQIQI